MIHIIRTKKMKCIHQKEVLLLGQLRKLSSCEVMTCSSYGFEGTKVDDL